MLKTQEKVYKGIIVGKRENTVFIPYDLSLENLGVIYPISTTVCTILTPEKYLLEIADGIGMKEGDEVKIHSVTKKLGKFPIYRKNVAEYKGEEIPLNYVTLL